jgi:hypothetical protein
MAATTMATMIDGTRLDAGKRYFGFSCGGSGRSGGRSFMGAVATCVGASALGISIPTSPRGARNHAGKLEDIIISPGPCGRYRRHFSVFR